MDTLGLGRQRRRRVTTGFTCSPYRLASDQPLSDFSLLRQVYAEVSVEHRLSPLGRRAPLTKDFTKRAIVYRSVGEYRRAHPKLGFVTGPRGAELIDKRVGRQAIGHVEHCR